MIREMENRDLLNTLTDAGLIPNYAFPESGVELKSVIWRRQQDSREILKHQPTNMKGRQPQRSQSLLQTIDFANQRRVEIDQINMDLASVEDWRLPNVSTCKNRAVQEDNLPIARDVEPPSGRGWSAETEFASISRSSQPPRMQIQE